MHTRLSSVNAQQIIALVHTSLLYKSAYQRNEKHAQLQKVHPWPCGNKHACCYSSSSNKTQKTDWRPIHSTRTTRIAHRRTAFIIELFSKNLLNTSFQICEKIFGPFERSWVLVRWLIRLFNFFLENYQRINIFSNLYAIKSKHRYPDLIRGTCDHSFRFCSFVAMCVYNSAVCLLRIFFMNSKAYRDK